MKPMNQDDLKTIEAVLDQAIEYGLEVEVIYWALESMRQDSNISPGQAMTLGVLEWIK